MTERNHELIKQAFERWNDGDYEIDYDTLDSDVELHTPLSSTSGTPYRGHAGFRRWVDDINDQFETWELAVDEWRPLEDGRLLGLGSIHARGRGSGVQLDQELAWLFAFHGEKLIRYDAFYSREEGLRAAGQAD
jgi:ketosteroid isomerase-like protein